MSNKLNIPTIFSAVDNMSTPLGHMGSAADGLMGKLSRFSAMSNRMFNKLTPSLDKTTRRVLDYAKSAILIGGAYSIGRFSVDSVMQYETALASLQAVTGVSDDKMKQFRSEIEDLGKTSKKSGIDITKSFETVGSMMSQYLDDPKALRQITEAGILLSKASRQELEPSLQSLTSVMNQFMLGAQGAHDTVEKLTAGEIVGSLRTAEVSAALQQFGANAYTANVSLAESVALVETLAKQRPVENVGIDARNILLVMASAKALDKEARKSLRKSGVDLDFLMDKTHSLSARLHELQKVQGNAVGMAKVFGERNVTAANVIFSQLGTYDQFAKKIMTTAEAEKQAALNTLPLSSLLDQLKARWVNMLNGSTDVAGGLQKVKNAVIYVTDHLEELISYGVTVLKFYAGWKAINIAMNIVLAINNALVIAKTFILGTNTAATAANTVSTEVAIVAQRGFGAATIASSEGMLALNMALLASPIGIVIAGAAALATGLYFLSQREEELNKQYREDIHRRSIEVMKQERQAVMELAAKYQELGKSQKEANAIALSANKARIDVDRRNIEAKIKATQAELKKEKEKIYAGDLFTGAFGEGHAMYGRRQELADQLYEQQKMAGRYAGQNLEAAQIGKEYEGRGLLDSKDRYRIFQPDLPKVTPSVDYGSFEKFDMWTNPMRDSAGESNGSLMVTIKNDSASAVDVVKDKTQAKSVMPNTASTLK